VTSELMTIGKCSRAMLRESSCATLAWAIKHVMEIERPIVLMLTNV
jgi:hypothetical protein